MQSLMRVGSVCLWLVLLACFAQAETRHIHLLKILDNQNADYVIREGCNSIDYAIAEEIGQLRDKLGILSVIEYNIAGAEFGLEKLDEVLTYDMEYLERDIVVVVYVGHGFRDIGTNGTFPELYFNSYDESVSYNDIQERILEKKPSLLLNIIIACNVTVEDKSLPPPYKSINETPPIVTLKGGKRPRRWQNYQHLFSDVDNHTKVIDLVSADREFFTFISMDGGIFFNEILRTFQEVLSDDTYASWDDVCLAIQQRTRERSERQAIQQRPFCNYYVRMNPIELAVRQERRLFRRASQCEREIKDLRQGMRQQLKNLRRHHRERMQQLRRSGAERSTRRIQAREQRVELEQLKLTHEKTIQRRLLQCR